MLDRRPGDRKAVEGRRAAPISSRRPASVRRPVENGGGFHHLDHEGRASARQIVGGADAREQTVDNAELGALSPAQAAHLSQNNDERVLTQERRLAGHVRPGEQPDASRTCVGRRRKIAIVGDERIADRLFDHSMAAALDDKVERAVDVRANVRTFDRERRKPARNIEHGQRLGGGLDLIARGDCRGREFFEHLKLEVERAVGGVGDFRFELAELGGGESDLAGEGLAVNEGRAERRPRSFSPCWAVTSTK